jgi:V8-like Glu-specific endopeptidase
MYAMSGIPGKLLRSLKTTLAKCEQFETDRTLKAVFVNELLRPWRDQLPQANSVKERVDLVIDRLLNKRRADTQTSVLVLLLDVLRDDYVVDDSLYGELDDLVQELGNILQLSISPRPSHTREEANPENQQMIFSAEWLKLLESIQAVGKVDVPQIIRGQLTERFPTGTGWLVAPRLALTCWHVMKARGKFDGRLRDTDREMQVTNSVLAFDYVQPGQGVQYQITALECYDATLDYALLSLQDRADYPLNNRGFLKLDLDVPLTLQTGLYIIQHPKGQPQQNSSGRFMKYKDGQPECILHSAPTEEGTSGAPVLNITNWNVVALHNGEDDSANLREATLLRAILRHIQQARPELYNEIINTP